MKNEDVKVGMKVVPHTKTVGCGLGSSWEWSIVSSASAPYLYVIEWDDEGYWILSHDPRSETGDFYDASDFESFVDNIDQRIAQLQTEIKSLRRLKRQNAKG